MHEPVRPGSLACTVRVEAELVALCRVVGRDRGVARVSGHGRPGPPEQEPPDAALVRHERHTEVGTETGEVARRLDPPLRWDQEVPLGRVGEVVGVPVAFRRWTLLRGDRHACHARALMSAVFDLGTPALVVDAAALEHNLTTMADALPGGRCRPHVKAHKTTALAHRQRAHGHQTFTCATAREMIGMAEAGLGDDLLLANELVDEDRLKALATLDARVTVAVDSPRTVAAAADAGLTECVIDVNVGLPRCGCAPDDAAALAELAASRGLAVRGVMGYEGHVVGLTDRGERVRQTAECMALLRQAHDAVGGDLISAGGTGTYDVNTVATEIQAGSYALMDTAYGALSLPFRRALAISATVVSTNPSGGYAVADCGLKSLGMDHGNPTIDGATVWFCSDEHVTFSINDDGGGAAQLPAVGDRVSVWPAHVDPTVAYHERMHITDGERVLETWDVDLRGW
jgi:D-serine deaminase-like pyridoxal phosphate-dependent protein